MVVPIESDGRILRETGPGCHWQRAHSQSVFVQLPRKATDGGVAPVSVALCKLYGTTTLGEILTFAVRVSLRTDVVEGSSSESVADLLSSGFL